MGHPLNHLLTDAVGLLGVGLVGWWAFTPSLAPEPSPERPLQVAATSATAETPVSGPGTVARGAPCTIPGGGYLRGRIYGAIELTADWSGATLLCDGMERPDGHGVRLLFAREQAGTGRIVLLAGIDLDPAAPEGREHPANVTVIAEPGGESGHDDPRSRLYSSGGAGRCWADVTAAAKGLGGERRVAGTLYCSGALPSLQDRSSITLGDLAFAGRLRPGGN